MANISSQAAVPSEPLDPKQHNFTTALTSLAVLYFMNGFITCLNDTLVPFFKKGFTLTYSESSLVQFYFFLTYGVMSFPAGKIVERIGYKNGMVLGFFVSAFGALLFVPASMMHEYYIFLAALFVLAIGVVLLQVAANPYITILGPVRTASSRLTLIQAVGSIGTTVAPIFGAYFILSRLQESHASSDAVKYPYIGIAVLLILIAVVVLYLKLPDLKPGTNVEVPPSSDGKTLFSFRNLNLGAIGIFVYVGAEVSVGTFLTNYISDTLAIPVNEANTFVAFYWGSMLVGRLIGSWLLKSIKPAAVLTTCAAMAISCIFISINTGGYIAVWSMIAVGFCNSVMFAIIFSLSVEGVGKFTTQASGVLSTAIAGGAIISFSQGLLKDHSTWFFAFMIPLACYVYIMFYGINGYKPKLN
jgi:FHS family L-fucose permease-like MFS transporter